MSESAVLPQEVTEVLQFLLEHNLRTHSDESGKAYGIVGRMRREAVARESRLAELEGLAKKSLLLMKEEHEMRTQESGGAFFPGGWLDHINELSAALSTSEVGNG